MKFYRKFCALLLIFALIILTPGITKAETVSINNKAYTIGMASSDLDKLAKYFVKQAQSKADAIVIKYTGSEDFNKMFSPISSKKVYIDNKRYYYIPLFHKYVHDHCSDYNLGGGRLMATYKEYYDPTAKIMAYYDITYTDFTETDAFIQQKVKELGVDTKSTLTDYEKTKIIHDFVCEQIESKNFMGDSTYDGSEYLAITEGVGNCQIHSRLFQRMCKFAGVTADVVCGLAGSEGHMWNRVLLDGKWYMLDCTFDDTNDSRICNYDYYLFSLDNTLYMPYLYEYGKSDIKENPSLKGYCTGSSISDLEWADSTCKIRISNSKITLAKGKSKVIKLTPGVSNLKWKSSNTKVAKVNSKGKITAVKKGTCYISTQYNGITYKCKVTVK